MIVLSSLVIEVRKFHGFLVIGNDALHPARTNPQLPARRPHTQTINGLPQRASVGPHRHTSYRTFTASRAHTRQASPGRCWGRRDGGTSAPPHARADREVFSTSQHTISTSHQLRISTSHLRIASQRLNARSERYHLGMSRYSKFMWNFLAFCHCELLFTPSFFLFVN